MAGGQAGPRAGHGSSSGVTGSRWKANRLLLAILVPLALLTLVAMIWMWPSGSREGITLNNPYSSAPGAMFESGRIQRVEQEGCVQ